MATKTGTRMIRTTVRTFAGLYSETTRGAVTGSSATLLYRVDHFERHRDQVDAFGAGHPGPDQVAGPQRVKIHGGFARDERGRAVDLGRLVLGPALDLARHHRVDQDLDDRVESLLGPLGAQLVGQRDQPVVPPLDGVFPDLAGQAGRLGAVLVAVVEDADRVESRVGQEADQLVDVLPGLAGE